MSAPKHRKDVPVDSCAEGWRAIPCGVCADYTYTRRATHRAEDPA